MEKTVEIRYLEHELGIELFVNSDKNIYSSLKLNKTVIINDAQKVIGLNLSYCKIKNLKILSKFIDVEYLYLSNNEIVDLNFIKEFKKLKILDLSFNKIENIDAISNLIELEILHLNDNKILELPLLNTTKLFELYAGKNRIKSIDNLKNLKSIFSLNFNENLIDDIGVIVFFPKLKNLSLESNKLKDLGAFTKFRSFIKLNLSKNKIEDIRDLRGLEIIEELSIGENNIFDLSPLYFSLKKNKINFLNAFGNPLVYPPFEVVQRGEDTIVGWFDMIINSVKEKIKLNKKSEDPKLDIGRMGLTDLNMIPELFDLKHLKELIISNEWAEYDYENKRWILVESDNIILKNNISNIPNEISRLTNLEKIIIGGDWKGKKDNNYNKWRIKDISSLFSLKKLKFFNVSNNQVENISDIIKLENVEIGHLNNNRIINVPKLNKLKKVKEIYLSNNLIYSVDFLKDCIQIETVDLHSNQITDLSSLVDLLKKSTIQIKNSSWEKNCISISKNSPNINPPYEVLNLTKNDFFLYLKQLEYESKLNLESYYNKEIKIVLVGNSYSGKSTFLNYLKTKRFKKGLSSTHWLVTEELEDIKIENETFKLRFFDFGGQDYYHDTHKMFFSSDCLYLLLWDKKSNLLDRITIDRNNSNEEVQVFPLEYWLDSIKIFAKKSLSESQKQMEQLLDERDRQINSKIRNKNNGNWISNVYDSNELINKTLEHKNILVIQNKIDIEKDFLNQTQLLKEYSNIYDFANISISKNQGLKQFQELYEDLLKKNINYKRPLLATWGYIKDNLNDVFKNDKFIIEINTFKKRINDYLSIWLKKELNKSENEISLILFNDEEIILFANFLKEIGLVIFNSENQTLKNNVIVNQNIFLKEVSKLLNIAKDKKGIIEKNDSKKIEYFEQNILTLISHNIIFENISEKNYIAPLFLPENPDFLIDLLVDLKIPYKRFKFDGFIPTSIILSVFSKIIKVENVSKEDFYFWKNGLIFKNKNGDKILLKFNIGHDIGFAYIDVFNFEKNKNDSFVKEVTKIINNIIEIDCNEYKELITIDGQYFAEMKKLIFNYENGINYIETNNFSTKSIKHVSIFKYNSFMDDKLKKPNKKLFISYSKQDEKLVNNFIDHLSTLQSSGLIDSWYCTELKAGEDWNSKILEKLNEADIVCFMISPKFMSTPYIHKYEVKHTFRRYHNGENVKIVPIILDFIDWSRKYTFTSNSNEEIIWSLDKFTALPFTGKEIKEFKNENKAWFIVENALRVIIEEDINSEKDEDEIVRKFSPKIKKLYEDIISDNV